VKARGAELKALQAQGQRGAGEHEPWFVARKDMDSNTLWVVQGHDHPWLLSTELQMQDCSWVAGIPPAAGVMAAKTRYRQLDAACELITPSADQAGLRFAQPQWAVTPGQSAVLYQGDVCLGGGVIASSNVQNHF
jgi:tRNA-specific 2-thiouridylase